MTGIVEQTIVQVFSKILLIFKKQSNTDSSRISYHLTLPSSFVTYDWVLKFHISNNSNK